MMTINLVARPQREAARLYKRRIAASTKLWCDEQKRGPCADCGGRFHPCAMDFDHIDPATKVRGVSDLVAKGRPLAAIEAEIAKCELVCSNCHRVRTFKRLQDAAHAVPSRPG